MTAPTNALPLLDVSDLTVEFATRRGIVKAVQHVNIAVGKGETGSLVVYANRIVRAANRASAKPSDGCAAESMPS